MPLVPASSRGGGSGAISSSQSVGPLGSTQATLDFQSIDQTGHKLVIEAVVQDTAASGICLVTLNNDSGSNYNFEDLHGTDATPVSAGTAATTRFSVTCTGATPGGAIAGFVVVEIWEYTGATFDKPVRITSYQQSAGPSQTVKVIAGNWLSTSAVNRVTLTAATLWAVGSVARLYVVT